MYVQKEYPLFGGASSQAFPGTVVPAKIDVFPHFLQMKMSAAVRVLTELPWYIGYNIVVCLFETPPFFHASYAVEVSLRAALLVA